MGIALSAGRPSPHATILARMLEIKQIVLPLRVAIEQLIFSLGLFQKLKCYRSFECSLFFEISARVSRAQSIEIIAPPLRHGDPLFPMFSAVIRSANLVSIRMRECALDCVWAPFARFV